MTLLDELKCDEALITYDDLKKKVDELTDQRVEMNDMLK